MCKIMMLTGIDDSKMALDFMRGASIPMSINDRDGIGYSAVNSQNELFMERWHNNKDFLNTDSVLTADIIAELEPFKARLPSLNVNYGSMGSVTRQDIRTVTMHTRMATCGREFRNTHPFVDQGISLIHNGVLTNANTLNLNKISSCDSENALQLYINKSLNLSQDESDFQTNFIDKLQGYWAFGILAKGLDDQYMLDIVREGANLYWAEIPEMGERCLVFATTETIINTAIASIGLPKRSKIYVMPESNYTRFNAVTGESIIDFSLNESKLNARPVYQSTFSYNTNKTKETTIKANKKVDLSDPHFYKDYDMWDNEYVDASTDIPPDVELDSEIEGFYDTNEPLIDRLYDFDALMTTSYGPSFEEMLVGTKVFIERKEEEEYLIFDDILLLIEDFVDNCSNTSIFKKYRELKRA